MEYIPTPEQKQGELDAIKNRNILCDLVKADIKEKQRLKKEEMLNPKRKYKKDS